MILDRRAFVATPLAVLTASAAAPAHADTEVVEAHGFRVDLSPAPVTQRDTLGVSVRRQMDIVAAVDLKPEIRTFFQSLPISIDPALEMSGRFGNGRVVLNARPQPPDNPVLLHEFLHGWHFERLRFTPGNEVLRAFYDAAVAAGDFPARAYMLSNVREFFAMTASVALWGRAARPPGTRQRLAETMPDYLAWLDRELSPAKA